MSYSYKTVYSNKYIALNHFQIRNKMLCMCYGNIFLGNKLNLKTYLHTLNIFFGKFFGIQLPNAHIKIIVQLLANVTVTSKNLFIQIC